MDTHMTVINCVLQACFSTYFRQTVLKPSGLSSFYLVLPRLSALHAGIKIPICIQKIIELKFVHLANDTDLTEIVEKEIIRCCQSNLSAKNTIQE